MSTSFINNPLLPLFIKENPYEELLTYFLQETSDTNFKLNSIQKELLFALLKGNNSELIYPRRSGTSTAIKLFLMFNLLTGKYKNVAIVSSEKDYIKTIFSKDIEGIINTINSISYNNNTVTQVSLNKISSEKDNYDLIILDNISDCDVVPYESRNFGISVYTSELKYDNSLNNINKFLITVKQKLSEIVDLYEESDKIDNIITQINSKIKTK